MKKKDQTAAVSLSSNSYDGLLWMGLLIVPSTIGCDGVLFTDTKPAVAGYLQVVSSFDIRHRSSQKAFPGGL